MLCICFSRYMTCLTLKMVQTNRESCFIFHTSKGILLSCFRARNSAQNNVFVSSLPAEVLLVRELLAAAGLCAVQRRARRRHLLQGLLRQDLRRQGLRLRRRGRHSAVRRPVSEPKQYISDTMFLGYCDCRGMPSVAITDSHYSVIFLGQLQ